MTAAGAIQFSNLSCSNIYAGCVVIPDSSGNLTAAPAVLGTNTTGQYVSGLDSHGGSITLDNSSYASNHITINTATLDNAGSPSLGIAEFNHTNLTVTSGVVNTIQNINTGASPTFVGLTTSGTIGNSNSSGIALNLTGTPQTSAGTSLIQIGSALAGGASSSANGTYLGINEPSSGAGSASDFLNFQNNNNVELRVTSAGAVATGSTLNLGALGSTVNTPICVSSTSGGVIGTCGTNAAVVTLQQAYNASTSPQIVLNSSPGAGGLIVKDNSTPLGGTLFAVQSGTSSTNYLGVSATTVSVIDNVNVTGNLQFQAADTINAVSAASGTVLTIQGGAATSGTNVGGNLLLQGGAGASTGASGSVAVQSNGINSTTAFEVQLAAGGNPIFQVDTLHSRVGINEGGSTPSFDLSFGSGANRTIGVESSSSGTGAGLTISSGATSAGGVNSGGTLALQGGTNTSSGTTTGGNISLFGGSATGAGGGVTVSGGSNAVSGSGGSISLVGGNATSPTSSNSGGGVYLYSGGGTGLSGVVAGTTVQNLFNNSTTAFLVQNTASNALFTVDASNDNIIIGGISTSWSAPSWSNTTTISSSLAYAASVAANGYVYEIGGTTNGVASGVVNSVSYAPINGNGSIGSWTATTSLNTGVFNAGAVVLNGYVYVIGGAGSGGDLTKVQWAQLNPNGTVGSWTNGSGGGLLPQRLGGASIVATNNTIYVIGGNDSTTSGIQNTVYYAQPGANGAITAWTTSASTINGSTGIAYGSAVISNGYVFVLGGSTTASNYYPTGLTATSAIYSAPLYSDGSLGSFSTQGVSLPTATDLAYAAIQNNELYVFGGQNSSGNAIASISNEQPCNISSHNISGCTTLSSGSSPLYGSAGATSSNGYVYLIGGYTGSSYANSVQYSSIASPNNALTVSETINGSLITQGGVSATSFLSTGGNLTVAGSATISGLSTLTGGAIIGGSGSTNSTSLLSVQNASGSSLLNVDSVNQRVNIVSTFSPMSSPLNLVANAASGGSLSVTTYYYKVTALDNDGGQTTVSNESFATTNGGNLSVSLTWNQVVGAASYEIYRSTSTGAERYLATVLSNAYTDTGSSSTTTTVPPVSNTAYKSSANSGTSTINQLSVGGYGLPTGQVYVSGYTPTPVGYAGTGGSGLYMNVAVQGRYAYVVSTGINTIQTVDISTPAAPTGLGSASTDTKPTGIAVQGRYAYVVNNTSNTLQVFDISNPNAPVKVSGTSTSTNPNNVYVQGRYAYVVSGTIGGATGSLQIFDVSNPVSPVALSTTATRGGALSIQVVGRYAYIGDGINGSNGRLQIFDVSNASTPTIMSSTIVGNGNPTIVSIAVQGRYVYLTDDTSDQVDIIDASNLSSPTIVNSGFQIGGGADVSGVYVQGHFLYVLDNTDQELCAADITNPDQVANVNCGNNLGGYNASIVGRYAYIATGSGVQAMDLGGEYTQQLEAGGTQTGTLQVDNNANIAGDETIQGGLQIGTSLQVAGTVGINGNINLVGTSLATPAAPTLTGGGVGSLSAGTYYYKLAAVNTNSLSAAIASSPTNVTDGSSSANTLTWSAVSGASGYIIYESSNGGTTWYSYEVSGNLTSFTDNGTVVWANSGSVTPPSSATSGGNLTLTGNVNSTGGTIQTNSVTRIDNSGNLLNIGYISGQSNTVTINDASNSATAFVVQNVSGFAVLTADTSNGSQPQGQVVLGQGSHNNGALAFANSSNNNTVTLIASTSTSSNYTLTLPSSPGATGNCLEQSGTLGILQFAACGSGTSGLAKNATDSSSASVTPGNAYLYQFSNSSTSQASGVLSLNNGSNTNSTLNVTATAAPSGSGQALIFGSIQSASPSGKLLDLQAGASPASVFSVSTNNSGVGTVTVSDGSSYTSSGAVTLSSSGSNKAVNIDTGASAAINIGATNATSIVLGGNTSATITENIANSSTTAFKLQTAGSTAILTADTTNSKLTVGATGATPIILVLANKNTSGDPGTEVDGAMYYNSNTGNFRCGESGLWENCLGGLITSNTSASGTLSNCGNSGSACAPFSTSAALPANYCQPGKVITLTANGVYNTFSTTQKLGFGVYMGPNTSTLQLIGAASSFSTPAQSNASNVGWGVNFTIICDTTGNPGTVTGEGNTYVGLTALTESNAPMYSATTTNINTTIAQNVYLVPTFATANAGNTITAEQYIVTGY